MELAVLWLSALVCLLVGFILKLLSTNIDLKDRLARLESDLAKQRETLVIGVARRKSMLHDLDRVLGEYR